MRKTFKMFFNGLVPGFCRKLLLKMQYRKIIIDPSSEDKIEILIKAGKVPSEIYFLKSEILCITSVDTKTKYILLNSGGVYGEAYVLFNCPSGYNLLCENISKKEYAVEVYKVEVEDYINTIKENFEIYKILREDALKKRKIYRMLKRNQIDSKNQNYKGNNKIHKESAIDNKTGRPSEVSDDDLDLKPSFLPDDFNESIGKKNKLDETNVKNHREKLSETIFHYDELGIDDKTLLKMEYDYNSEDEFGNYEDRKSVV